MCLYRYSDEILLVGSGINTPSEKEAPGCRVTLPDLRILIPFFARIRGWVIFEDDPAIIDAVALILPHIQLRTIHVRRSLAPRLRAHPLFSAKDIQIKIIEDFIERGIQIEPFTITAERMPDGTPDFNVVEITAGNLHTLSIANTDLIPRDHTASERRYHAVVVGRGSVDPIIPIFAAERYLCIGSTEDSTEQVSSVGIGTVADMTEDSTCLLPRPVPIETFVMDGNGLSTLGSHVLLARRQMGVSGVVVVVFTVDRATQTIIGYLRIETRGVAHLHEARDVHAFIIKSARTSYEETLRDVPDIEEKDLVKIIRKDVERMLTNRYERMPTIIPIIVKV